MSRPWRLLPLGSLRPSGWLLDQLRIQADGLTGQLEELWPDVGPQSGWLGGPGECWERGPYYLDGLVPLGWLLDDDRLQRRASRWIEWTLASQRDDGFFGPEANRDWWPRMVMLKVLLQQHAATGDERIPELVERYLRYQHAHLAEHPLEMWAHARGAENLAPVLFCLERTDEPWLHELAEVLLEQTIDWTALYRDFPYPGPVATLPLGRLLRAYLPPRTAVEKLVRRLRPARNSRTLRARRVQRANRSRAQAFYHRTHGVNHAMAVKVPALAALVRGADGGAAASRAALAVLLRHHGSVVGVVVADEHLAGTSPVHGIELCTVVETMYSLEELVRLTGDGWFGDLLERVAFNALPAAVTEDWLGHQYYQQVNQIEVSRRRRPWFNGGRDGTLFGLEPTYGCCTANVHQGWPKLAASAVLATDDEGLAVVTYVPCELATSVAGRAVSLSVETGYPFSGDVTLTFGAATDAAVTLPLHLRIPAWADSAELSVAGEPVPVVVRSGFARVERTWYPGDVVRLRLPMTPRVEAVAGDPSSTSAQASVLRGPLVLALPLDEHWRALPGRHAVPDREVRTDHPWSFGLCDQAPTAADVTERPVGPVPFSHEHPPVEVGVRVRRVADWQSEDGSAGRLPDHVRPAPGSVVEVRRLVPYGSTALRVAVFPRLGC